MCRGEPSDAFQVTIPHLAAVVRVDRKDVVFALDVEHAVGDHRAGVDRAAEVDGSGKRVRLDGAGWLNYDHLVIATGIGFDDPPGIDYQKTPHAWIAGPQTQLLASQVGALGPKSTFVMTVPKSPYRCPPGPYERACLVADILDRRGFNQGDAKIVVLDANAHIQAERHTFEKAFFDKYRNIVDYRPNVTLNAVDSQQRRLDTSAGQFEGDVVNVIPNQQAPVLMVPPEHQAKIKPILAEIQQGLRFVS